MEKPRQLKLNQRPDNDGLCVVYVMSRDQRIRDNHALVAAQKSAIAKKLPIVVVFNLLPSSGVRAREHYEFMVSGLKQVDEELQKLNIPFVVLTGEPTKTIPHFANKQGVTEIFFDFNPLNGVRKAQKNIASSVDCPVTVIDTHNIIPAWVLSDKEEFAAHTIRRKVHKNLEQWLAEPEQTAKHPHTLQTQLQSLSWREVDSVIAKINSNDTMIDILPGEKAAHTQLRQFMDNGLSSYASERNNPTVDGQSSLSPYLHFGQISALRVALELLSVAKEPPLLFREPRLSSYEGKPTPMDSINALLEELIVRKELADNYCFYNPDYASIKGAKEWAQKTLNEHRNSPRDFIYTQDQWEAANTHDEPWNAAQREMMITGKMHGYMRMYWAKKILEWSASPEEAIATAIYLNDRYSIDGGDPNGYTGIMWSIAGVHDRAWFERPVFGKIRYMNAGGLKRKFNLEGYLNTWLK